MPQTPIFRFAPSPNGWLHLGHAASALLNADLAARMDGAMLLRIEDIDPVRSRPEFVDGILEDLDWLGLHWPEPVLRQSAHMPRYAQALGSLVERGLAYPCFCTRGQTLRYVAEKPGQWPRDPDGAPLHAGPCRALDRREAAERVTSGEPHAWRLAMDAALAEIGQSPCWIEWDPASNTHREIAASPQLWGDVVIGRKDVPTSYHLSVVLDDAMQGVTHVVRGADLREATAVHRVLQELLSLPVPVYHHHQLILDQAGRKLAKSLSSTPLRELRQQGLSPAAIRAQIGWFSEHPGSPATPSS